MPGGDGGKPLYCMACPTAKTPSGSQRPSWLPSAPWIPRTASGSPGICYGSNLRAVICAFATGPATSRGGAEFGVSVLPSARGRGLGTQLFGRAVMHARNEGVRMVFIHALSDNQAMLKIARNAGASVRRDGAQSEAYLQIPPANLDTRMAEIVEQQFAEFDYQYKTQAKQFSDFLARLQEMRSDLRHAGMDER